MFKSLKRVLATASTLALLVSNTGIAFAQTFKDVSTDAWYYDYVETLVNDGVVDAGNNFRPNDSLNRAEMAKLVVTAVDGLADYSAPATPTFDDVPTNAWYYDYVEAAVQLGIVAGYTDARGNLTGKYGPGDTLNRAAATKILVNAFSVETTLEPASIFPDVVKGTWFYDYAVTAYNQSILDGYQNGKFGPSDVVTRAQVAKLMVNAQNPTLREETTPPAGEGTTPPPAAKGALEVSLNDMTAASSTLPLSASSVKVASFDFTAADSDVTISNMVVTRGGVGKASDWDNLYLYDGANRITTGRSINSDTNTSTFAVNVTVDAGTTKTLTLVGDVTAGAGPSNQHYFYIASAADVTTGAKSVSGDFPVAGNTFTMGGAATVVTTTTVSTGSAISQPVIGQKDAEVASFKLTAGAQDDVALHQISLTQNGSLSSDKMVNLKLLRGTDEVATAKAFDSDRVTFVLATPYVIPKGQNKTFYVHADINGGRTTDTVQLYLDENTDLVVIDQQYGYGSLVSNLCTAAVPNGFKPAAAPCVGVTATNLKGGTVTVTDNGPAGHQIAQNTTNVHLLDYAVTAGRDLTVKNMDLTIDVSTAGTALTRPNVGALGTATVGVIAATNKTNLACVTTATIAPAASIVANDMISMPAATGTVYAIVTAVAAGPVGTCLGTETQITTNIAVASGVALVAGTVTEINPYTLVKNVKVVDLDSGSTLQGPMTKASDGTVSAALLSTYTKTMPEDYELVGGETRHLGILVDIDQTMAAGYKIGAGISYNVAGYIKDMAANENVLLSDVVGGVLTSKFMSVASNSLSVARSSNPSSQTYVKGEDKVAALAVALTSGDAGDISVKKLNLRVYGNNALAAAPLNAWATLRGNIAANTLVSTITLYDGNDVVDGPRTMTLVDGNADGIWQAGEYFKVLFDNLSLKVAKGSTRTLTAKVKLLNSFVGPMYIALDMDPANDITAEDSDANTITASGGAFSTLPLASTLNTINDTTVVTTNYVVMTAINNGVLSVASWGNPESKNLVAGSTMQLVSKFKFNALKEGFNVNKLTILNDDPVADLTQTFDTPVDTSATAQIALKYNDINGVSQTKTGNLSGGSATLSDLGFFVPTGTDAYVEVYANVSTMGIVGEKLSGKFFRLGLRDVANTVSTFDATGVSSSTTFNATGVGPDVVTFDNPGSVNTFVVRKSVPTFSSVTLNETMRNGAKLLDFKVSADSQGAVSFARLVYDVTPNLAALNVANFNMYVNETLVPNTKLHIWTTQGAGKDVRQGSGNAITGAAITEKVIVAFNSEDENSISAGQQKTFSLRADVSGGVASGNRVSTSLAIGDENVPVAGIVATSTCSTGNDEPCSTGNGNTGLLCDNGATEGLFADCAPVGTTFVTTAVAARNVIWSDGSADARFYPAVCTAAGVPVAACTADGDVIQRTSAVPARVNNGYDWTNGFDLKVTSLSSNAVNY